MHFKIQTLTNNKAVTLDLYLEILSNDHFFCCHTRYIMREISCQSTILMTAKLNHTLYCDAGNIKFAITAISPKSGKKQETQ
jgi:hypothetical protein